MIKQKHGLLTTTQLQALAIQYISCLEKFRFDIDRDKGIIHSRIINLAFPKRSWSYVDAFTLEIYRYLLALIDLATVASQLIFLLEGRYVWISSCVVFILMAEREENGVDEHLLLPKHV